MILLWVLIDCWFAGRLQEIEQLLLIDAFETVEGQLLREGGTTYSGKGLKEKEENYYSNSYALKHAYCNI